MSDETPIFALNIMFLTYDTFYLIRDGDYDASQDTREFVESNPTWVRDEERHGWVHPRTPASPTQVTAPGENPAQ